jgi:hypothetical protein
MTRSFHNKDLIHRRLNGYVKFWGRKTDIVGCQSDDEIPHVDIYRFPRVETKAIMAHAVVYVTSGMSDLPMPNTEELDKAFRYAEITAYARQPLMTDSGESDFISWMCHWFAHYPFRTKTHFLPGQTFDYGKSIISGSEMEGFYFANTPFIDRKKLSRASVTAKTFLHLIPISRKEMELKLNEGADALLDLFGKVSMDPLFDLSRKSLL